MSILKTLQEFYGAENVGIQQAEPVIYRCVKRSELNTAYQIVYIDFSNSWLTTDFNSNLDNFLVDDYYANAGYLQWNFYYYFISDQSVIADNVERKNQIENDEAYARKYVMEVSQFSIWLQSFSSIGQQTTSQLSNDLFSIWINYLEENKIWFVYDDINFPNYTRWVEAYINGENLGESSASNVSSPVAMDDIGKLKEIKINSFRPYPVGQPFHFAPVTLIHGPNASGKSSLLETIELVVTGKGNSTPLPGYDLELINDENRTFKFPDDNAKYKQRDIGWYKSAMTRGHILNENFNKFNYYASDAAHKLKISNDSGRYDLQGTLSDVALGREVNRLEERAIEFSKRFESASANLLNEQTAIADDLLEKTNRINVLKNTVTEAQDYKSSLIAALQKIAWKNIEHFEPSKDGFAILETSLELVFQSLVNITNVPSVKKFTSYFEVHSRVLELESKVNLFNIQQHQIDLLSNERQESDKRIGELTSIDELLQQLQKICKHGNFASLFGLAQNLSDVKRRINLLESVVNSGLPLKRNSPVLNASFENQTLLHIETELNRRLQTVASELKELNYEKNQLDATTNELTKIISSIKASGIHYVELSPESDFCPLCNTDFAPKQLLIALTSTRNNLKQSDALVNIAKRISDLNIIVQNLLDLNKVFVAYQSFALQQFQGEWQNKTIAQILIQIDLLEKTLSNTKEEYIKLTSFEYEFTIDNISELSAKNLQNRIFELLNVKVTDLTTCEEQIADVNKRLFALNVRRNTIDADIKKANKIIAEEVFDSTQSSEKALIENLTLFLNLEVNFKQVETHIDLTTINDLSLLHNEFQSVKSSFEVYKRNYGEINDNRKALEYVEADITALQVKQTSVSAKKVNANKAFALLNTMLRQHNKTIFLRDYIQENKKEISEIFRLIHSPVEFKGIDIVDNKLKLLSINQTSRELDQISTGQRSALALSIFLALNRKLSTGPKFILFDDPVTYVDDLNVLSFLDYLRELFLRTNRQILFATANDDLAFFFKKKFQFLENSAFVEIQLERPN